MAFFAHNIYPALFLTFIILFIFWLLKEVEIWLSVYLVLATHGFWRMRMVKGGSKRDWARKSHLYVAADINYSLSSFFSSCILSGRVVFGIHQTNTGLFHLQNGSFLPCAPVRNVECVYMITPKNLTGYSYDTCAT